ncbi:MULTISPECIES: DUF2809 domain-containing protein [unclassified Streptomyces]|uniref:ribosomal maturation YjgA family protein n=1 Tax=unclassified Streptomyces TaxID=2593676 RepID=UPI00283A999A|nr:DUF2809 domain-containing protein [Streptomyces sp. PsTaAH-137]
MITRWGALGGAVVTVAAGLGVRAWAHGAFAKYAGDALYTVLVCWVVALAAPRLRAGVVAGAGLAFSWAVEFMQIAGIPALLRPLLGATFNPPDLFWYVVGAGLYWCLALGVSGPEGGWTARRRVPPRNGPGRSTAG